MRTLQKDPQGEKPVFSSQALAEVEKIYKRYPPERRRSALMPILHLAQKEFGGWLSQESLDYIAEIMDVPPIRVYEVATFYTMYNLKPVGKYHVQVCTNISCWLCNADGIVGALKEKLQLDVGDTSKDERFTLTEVECLGACVNAPMMQINDDYFEKLSPENVGDVIDRLP
ncbi:NADH-quinone oxidoreductase subunit NuoE [Magnetococcales bacterium HHB-1]